MKQFLSFWIVFNVCFNVVALLFIGNTSPFVAIGVAIFSAYWYYVMVSLSKIGRYQK